QHVLSQRELAHVGRGTVGDHVTLGDFLAHVDQRTLVDVGVLVGAGVLDQIVDVHPDVAGDGLVVIDAHHDATRIDVIDDAAAQGLHRSAGVDRYRALDPGSHQGLLRTQAGYRLALHVGAHQR